MRFFLSIALCGVLLFCSCARESGMRSRVSRVSDSLYMARAAMKVYGMEPERALTIIDSALITGNVSPFQADFLRAKVYANSLEDALQQLRNMPEKSIKDIAKDVGLTPANFRELFKHQYGMTPTEFKQNL